MTNMMMSERPCLLLYWDPAAQKAEAKKRRKEQKKRAKANTINSKLDTKTQKRVFVVKFNGNVSASAVTNLREEVTAILTQAKSDDEVVVKLESSGGMGSQLWSCK